MRRMKRVSLLECYACETRGTRSGEEERNSGFSRRLFGWSLSVSSISSTLAGLVLTGFPSSSYAFENPEVLGNGYKKIYGEATTAASYGGYGGSDKSDDRFKYTYIVPENWRGDIINKVEKGVNGIDNRQFPTENNANKKEKAYVITFPGYLKLKDDRESIISDLAIGDIQLQDILQGQESFESSNRMVDDQLFYDYDITGFNQKCLASATVDGGRLYILFVLTSVNNYNKEKDKYDFMQKSLKTLSKGVNQDDVEYFKRAT